MYSSKFADFIGKNQAKASNPLCERVILKTREFQTYGSGKQIGVAQKRWTV